MVEHFACSNDEHRSTWNDGIRPFEDPLVFGYMITEVYAVLLGSFHCVPSAKDAEVRILVNDLIQTSATIPAIPFSGCLCPRCATTFRMPPSKHYKHGWPSYNYFEANDVQVMLTNSKMQSICLSQIRLSFYTKRVFPKILKVVPPLAPLNSTTIILVEVDYYDPDIRYNCDFGFINTTSAVRVNATALACRVPSLEIGERDRDLVVLPEWADRNATYNQKVRFSFYEEPIIEKIEPNNGTDGDVITIHGDGFFNSPYAICRFGNVTSRARFISPFKVECDVPRMDVDINSVDVLLTLNGQQYHNTSHIFTFNYHSRIPLIPLRPKITKNSVIWWVVGILGSVILGVLGFTLYICVRKPKDSYQKIKNFEPTDEIVIDQKELDIRERIGRGSFGDIHRGYWRSTEVAIKLIPSVRLKPHFIRELWKEAGIMRNLRHPNILSILGCCTVMPDLCIVMEYMTMGSLYTILQSDVELPWKLLQKMALDAARGMNFLHKSNPIVMHRDLKTQNLLVDENWRVKVSDFGLSRLIEEQVSQTMTVCGTPCWTAPEVLRNQKYSIKADVYSFGICLWEMYSRTDPYKGVPPYQVVLNVANYGMRPEIGDDCPEDWAKLIADCWDEDPQKRPSFEDIIIKLENLQLPLD